MRVLIADDDRLSAHILEANLKKSGYDVTVVADGSRAWEILSSENRPPIAILDWRMPVMDGLEVCRKVRASSGPYVYILLLTGNMDPDAVVTGIDAGADDYIKKPFDPAELHARLRSGRRIVELEEKLRRQANHDALTGLLNRRAVIQRLATEIERANEQREPLFVAMVDIDHFKKINDTYGHRVGDTVLCEAAQGMRAVLRPNDTIGRYGGEEFVAIFPRCKEAEALAIAERIRRSIKGKGVHADSRIIPLTVSIGIAKARGAPSPDAVIHAADSALLRAKQGGRDRVERA
jgi:two-component system cell cycle response regulator